MGRSVVRHGVKGDEMRLPAGSDAILVWLFFLTVMVGLNFWYKARGKWTWSDGLVTVIVLIILGLILGPLYFDQVRNAERARLHRLYPHRHWED